MADETSRQELFNQLVIRGAELNVNIGLMSSVMDRMPEHAQENWELKLEAITTYLEQQIEEVQAFGEYFDG